MAKLLLDVSAWVRAGHPNATENWAHLVESESLLCHPVFAVELLHTAINPQDYRQRRENLDKAFDWVRPDEGTALLAIDMQRTMATTAPAGQRVKTADLLIAALAAQNDAGVLHYDLDYDAIRETGGAAFQSEWLAKRGTLEGDEARVANPRRAYSKAFQERMIQLQNGEDLAVWPRVIALMDGELRVRGLDIPAPPDGS